MIMKKNTRTLATVFVLICSFLLAPSLLRADQDDWYQGRQGQWVHQKKAWRFQDHDGNIYRQHGNSWAWYNGRHHGPEGSAYHNRPAGDNQTYNQFQNSH
jgi:hypothetical protein